MYNDSAKKAKRNIIKNKLGEYNMSILEIKDVTYNYSNSKEKILSSINQKFELGQFYAIIGKSGAGKSTR